jgi:hypothetical protein
MAYESVDIYNGISIGDVVTCKWKGYYRVTGIMIEERVDWNKTKSTVIRYHVKLFCHEDGIASSSGTRIRETGSIYKVTPDIVDAWATHSVRKWDRIKNELFPNSIKDVVEVSNEVEEAKMVFKPLDGLLRN